MSTFRIDQPFLQELLKDIGSGRIQLPDFQRDWVWNDDRIRSLIASVSREFPIGSVLTLKAGDTDMNFETRLVEGVNAIDVRGEPDTLILDGQQRLTALFQALMLGNVAFRRNAQGRKTRRYYYFHMDACTGNGTEREDAVISCREDHRLQIPTSNGKPKSIDLSSTQEQYENQMFPAHKIFDSADWKQGYMEHWDYDPDKTRSLFKFEAEIIQCFNRYNVPVIELGGASKEAICLVFEKVNTGGVTLTVFELLTASLAAEGFRLRDDWRRRHKRLREYKVLGKLDGINFLQALTLVDTKNRNAAISCKRKEILELDRKRYEEWADQVKAGFLRAARFLHRQKIFHAKDVPYSAQLVPLAAILTDLGHLSETDGVPQKIARWYWCGVLGEMYAGSTDTQAARDFSEVTTWIREGGKEPTTIREANFQEERLLELRTRNSALYKGIHALMMQDRGASDFRTGYPIDEKVFFEDRIDIHHIFPRAWCTEKGIASGDYNSIINKTAISARTNRMIGGCAPSAYLQRIQTESKIDDVKMDNRLAAHLISAEALRADDFWGFLEARKEALFRVIQKAMGKEPEKTNERPKTQWQQNLVDGNEGLAPRPRSGSRRKEKYTAYFQELIDQLREQHNFTKARRAMKGQNYYLFASGSTGIKYVAGFNKQQTVYMKLIINFGDREKNKSFFDVLKERESEINGQFDIPLKWERGETRRAAIRLIRDGDINADESELAAIKAWHIAYLLKLKAVFTPEIQRARETLKSQ
ncbi:MAG: DUF4268 domain-containing protein [Candidatus Poribacteria bacterium]|nr:DUF4268 domain-containing protein [Candidatus Poribacteria bacterium]